MHSDAVAAAGAGLIRFARRCGLIREQAAFSVFDDRETETRPNTLIEIGTAIGLGKPYFYFNYSDKRTVQIGSKREQITTASDLAGML